jgi:DNA-binding transcriptional regulator LsrR (DeoR family)
VAARFFEELVAASNPAESLHVGISGGDTLMSFAEAVKDRKRPNVHIHTLALLGRGEDKKPALASVSAKMLEAA